MKYFLIFFFSFYSILSKAQYCELSVTQSSTTGTLVSSCGNDPTIPVATTSLGGFMSAADKTSLDNVAANIVIPNGRLVYGNSGGTGLTSSANLTYLSGLLGLGQASSGARLHVRGAGTTTSTVNTRFETSGGVPTFQIKDGAQYIFGNDALRLNINSAGSENLAGGEVTFQTINAPSGNNFSFTYALSSNFTTSNNQGVFRSGGAFVGSSGSGTFHSWNIIPTINQSGSATGAVYGIDYNPTMTSITGIHYGLLLRPTTARLGIGTATPDKTFGIGDGTDEFAISVDSDKLTWWNDAGTPAISATLDSVGVLDVVLGYRINGSATSGNYLRGNGTNFVSSSIQAGDIPDLVATYWKLGGNSGAGYKTLGTAGNASLNFLANNTFAARLDSLGYWKFGPTLPTGTSAWHTFSASNLTNGVKINGTSNAYLLLSDNISEASWDGGLHWDGSELRFFTPVGKASITTAGTDRLNFGATGRVFSETVTDFDLSATDTARFMSTGAGTLTILGNAASHTFLNGLNLSAVFQGSASYGTVTSSQFTAGTVASFDSDQGTTVSSDNYVNITGSDSVNIAATNQLYVTSQDADAIFLGDVDVTVGDDMVVGIGDRGSISAADSMIVGTTNNRLTFAPTFTRLYGDTVNIAYQLNNTTLAHSFNSADNDGNAEVHSIRGGGSTYFTFNSTNGAEKLTLGPPTGSGTTYTASPTYVPQLIGVNVDTVAESINANAGTDATVAVTNSESTDVADAYTVKPTVALIPEDADAANAMVDLWVVPTTTGFTVHASGDLTGLTNTELLFAYQVIGGK